VVFEKVIFDKVFDEVSDSPKEDTVDFPITFNSKFIRFFFQMLFIHKLEKEILGQCFSTGVPENPWVP
jgi:hypothetical protein